MTKDEAISQAQEFVRNKYPMVPPIAGVQHFTERNLRLKQQLFIESWLRFPGSADMSRSVTWADVGNFESTGYNGKWLVIFFMSWDTDAVGMPQSLLVMVDDFDSSVTMISPE